MSHKFPDKDQYIWKRRTQEPVYNQNWLRILFYILFGYHMDLLRSLADKYKHQLRSFLDIQHLVRMVMGNMVMTVEFFQ